MQYCAEVNATCSFAANVKSCVGQIKTSESYKLAPKKQALKRQYSGYENLDFPGMKRVSLLFFTIKLASTVKNCFIEFHPCLYVQLKALCHVGSGLASSSRQ